MGGRLTKFSPTGKKPCASTHMPAFQLCLFVVELVFSHKLTCVFIERLTTVYLLLQVNLDQILYVQCDFDASSAQA